eukprot:2583494-Pleurochrysis_carterae.AAC.1
MTVEAAPSKIGAPMSGLVTPEAELAPSKIGAPTSGVVLCDDDIPAYSISHAVAASPYKRQVWRRRPAWPCVP